MHSKVVCFWFTFYSTDVIFDQILYCSSSYMKYSRLLLCYHVGPCAKVSWSWTLLGIGSGSAPLSQCVELASRPGRAQQWRRCKHLIIDEISMVDSTYFDKLEAVARAVRKKEIPFGGIQLILSGDFLQLPPVTKQPGTKKFCFQVKMELAIFLLVNNNNLYLYSHSYLL